MARGPSRSTSTFILPAFCTVPIGGRWRDALATVRGVGRADEPGRRRWAADTVNDAVTRVGDRVGGRVESVSRSVVDDLEPYLTEHTVPRVLDALVPHLVDHVVPQVVDGVTPALVDELLPEILDRLRPYLAEQLVPVLLDDLEPYLVEQTVPAVIDGVLPMIRTEVVPALLDDIVDDPRVRDLIREQSQGMVIDAVERVRSTLARGDDVVEGWLRWARRARTPVVEDPVDLPPGRVRSHAGVVTRMVALGIDLGLVSLVAVQGLAAVVAILSTVVDPVPTWVFASAAFVSAGLAPVYFTVAWWLAGRTIGGNLAGFAVCARDGQPLRFGHALVRAVLGVTAVPVWVVGMLHSSGNVYRRGWLDLLTRTRTPYRVHEQVRQETLGTQLS